MAWWTTITSELGSYSRDSNEEPAVAYSFKKFSLFFDVEWTAGAGYLNWQGNGGLDPINPVVVTTAPATLVITPKGDLNYGGMINDYAGSYFGCRCVDLNNINSYLKISNADKSKWVTIEGDFTAEETVVTYSDGVNDFTDAWGTTPDEDHFFYGLYYPGATSIDAQIKLREYYYVYDSIGLYNQTSVTDEPVFFTTGVDSIGVEMIFEFATTGVHVTDWIFFNFNGNSFYEDNNGDDFLFNWTNETYFELPFPTCVKTGSIDNDALMPLMIYDMVSPGTEFDADWTFNTNVYTTWYSTYVRLYDPDDQLWAAKYPDPLSLGNALEILVTRMTTGYVLLMNADASKWFKFGLTNSYVYDIEDSEGLFDETGVSMHSICLFKGELSADYSLDVLIEDLADGDPTDGGTYDLSRIFIPYEPLFIALGVHPSASYSGIYTSIIMQTMNAAPNTDQGQTAANNVYEPIKHLTYESDEEPGQEFYLYFKDKIRNSQDYSDLDSLFAINPTYASDAFNSLKAGEVCMVVDRYHRTYFYMVKAGSQATNLPTYININASLYWELIDYIQNDEMKVEQYDVVGLVDGTDKLITHTTHNRTKSYAPAIQLIHNGVIKTSDIVVSVVSTTQIRLSTDEVTAFENLKANVYVTV